MKRICDFILALGAFILFAPIILLLGILIKIDSSGPMFYRGLRIGYKGKPFYILKFRTMVMNADKIGGPSTADDDPRITKLGKFIRKYKLDELPQLINVLMGEMSFVGPRPEVPQYVEMFTEEEKAILSVRPGITDWASIWNSDEGALLAGSEDPEKTYLEDIRPQKIQLQLKYVREHSLSIDTQILWETFLTLFRTRTGKESLAGIAK